MNKKPNVLKLGLEIKFPVTAPNTDIKIAISHTGQQDKVERKKKAVLEGLKCFSDGRGIDIKTHVQSLI